MFKSLGSRIGSKEKNIDQTLKNVSSINEYIEEFLRKTFNPEILKAINYEVSYSFKDKKTSIKLSNKILAQELTFYKEDLLKLLLSKKIETKDIIISVFK